MFVADHVVYLFSRMGHQSPKDVLVIKSDKIGDFVVWLDSALEYRKCFPNESFILLADASWSKLATRIGWWDEVWPLDFKRFGNDIPYRIRTLHCIRRRRFAHVITTGRSFRYMDTIVRFSGAPERIGTDGNEALIQLGKEISISNRWFTRVLPLTPRRATTALELNLAFAIGLGARSRQPHLPCLPEHLTMANYSRIPLGRYVILVPGAAWPGRRWPLACFARIAQLITDNYMFKIVLCGSPSEQHLGDEMERLISNSMRRPFLNLIGQTDLAELISLLKGAKAVVTNETGTLHLAAAVGTKAICIAGGGDFGHLVPYPNNVITGNRPLPLTVFKRMACYGCGWRCHYKVPPQTPKPCIEGVSVKAVWSGFRYMIEKYVC